MTLKSLKSLLLDYNELVVLPRGFLSGLRNLEHLMLRGNRFSSLHGNMFNETKLTGLILWDNNLKQLPNDLFNGLGNLKKLDLGENYLRVLPKGLFVGLTNLEYLSLDRNHVNSLDEALFNGTNRLTKLTLYENDLTVLPKELLKELKHLEILNLGINQINSLDGNLFNETKNLTHLIFDHNNLVQLTNTLFRGLSNLRSLSLCYNKIIQIHVEMFRDLINLQLLYLHANRLKALNFNLFQYTRKIRVLNLSDNKLLNIPDISSLHELFYLNVKNNILTGITNKTFSNLTKETDLEVSQHEICECYVSNDVICTAVDDRSPFLTCDRLLADKALVVVMWLIALNAVAGNIFVLCQRKSKSDENEVQNFLLGNLAVSDLLMGVYMVLIASADIYFGEYFPMRAETWRSGINCRIVGTISIVSSEASVFFVTLISIDRFVSIKYHNSRWKLRQKSSTVVAIVLWIMAIVLGIVPSTLAGKNYNFYDNSHVCIGLPLSKLRIYNTEESEKWTSVCTDGDICYWKQLVESEYVGEVNGMIFASVMFLGLNFICYLVVLACYVEIIRTFYKSSKRAGRNPEMKEQIRLTSRVLAIVLTDFACWFPIIVIGILVQAGVLTLPPDVFAWCVTFVLPINSAINPYLYTIAGVISERRQQTRANDLKHGTHLPNQRGQKPDGLNTSDLELGVITK